MLKSMIVAERTESIDLDNGATIEIHTASYRTTRRYSCACVIADESAFWATDADGANPDTEIIKALRPSLATLPGSLLLGLSSPFSHRGVLWEQWKQHHGVEGSAVLTFQAPSEVMNPTLDAQTIADAYEQDSDGARAEWGAEFRSDLGALNSEATSRATFHAKPSMGAW